MSGYEAHTTKRPARPLPENLYKKRNLCRCNSIDGIIVFVWRRNTNTKKAINIRRDTPICTIYGIYVIRRKGLLIVFSSLLSTAIFVLFRCYTQDVLTTKCFARTDIVWTRRNGDIDVRFRLVSGDVRHRNLFVTGCIRHWWMGLFATHNRCKVIA